MPRMASTTPGIVHSVKCSQLYRRSHPPMECVLRANQEICSCVRRRCCSARRSIPGLGSRHRACYSSGVVVSEIHAGTHVDCSGPSPVPAPQLATSSGRPGSTAAGSCHAAGPALPPPDTAPRSASLADNSAPATPTPRRFPQFSQTSLPCCKTVATRTSIGSCTRCSIRGK